MNIRWKLAQFWEIRWWRWYLRHRDKAAYLQKKAAYWKRILSHCELELNGKEALLDAGCGPAGIFMVLEGKPLVAVDPLLEAYQKQLTHFDPSDYPHVEFVASPLEHFKPAQAMDIIFCCNVINHVADLELSMDRLCNWLKPGGTLILSVDVHNYQGLKSLFRAIPGDILHPHQHDVVDYQNMLRERGFRIEKTTCLKSGNIFDYYLIKAISPFNVITSPLVNSTSSQ
ncbi:MAG: class I SAM-dependent methyltransferase [Saprospiraceae bacterium]|nr:class I SAM-dependent methyltransferase [Saprospiraceae bacterium]